MMQCDTIKEMLSDYIDNTIEPNLELQIKEHLEDCSNCNRLVQQVKAITRRLNQIPPVKTSADFDKNLRTRIMEPDKSSTSSMPIRGMIYGLSGVTAAVAIYFITTTTIFSSSPDPIKPVNFQPSTGTQQNQITRQQPQVNIQPVDNTQDVLAEDSTKSKPTPLENRDINLVGSEQ